MNAREAVALIATAIPDGAATWADVGAGDGTFTRALTDLLGPAARIYAVDRDARALAVLRRWAAREGANVVPVEADFTQPLELPGLSEGTLDGMLLANALHFAPDAEVVLGRLVRLVRPGGRVVIVEYDRRAGSRWVPYPIAADRLPALAAAAGLSAPTITAARPSAFGGILYVAAADRPR
ncbi:MAG: class I SAM-dependent methyltransferase [Gemmatimonadaceae bacterium]